MGFRHAWSLHEPPGQRLPVGLAGFLTDRLREELAQLWERDDARHHAGQASLAAQLEAIDDVLTDLAVGHRPDPVVLALLMFAYATHPAYDSAWAGR